MLYNKDKVHKRRQVMCVKLTHKISNHVKPNTKGAKINCMRIALLSVPFLTYATAYATEAGEQEVFQVIAQITSYLMWAGFMIAIFKMIQIGIMYMTGIASSRSSAKSALLPWFVGAAVCVLFATVGPWVIDLIIGDTSKGPFDI